MAAFWVIIIIITFGAGDYRATLVLTLLHDAVMPNRFGERTDTEVTHQHLIVACTVEARLVCHDPIALIVVIVIIVASLCNVSVNCSIITLIDMKLHGNQRHHDHVEIGRSG